MTLCWLKTSSQVHVGEDLQTQQKNWKLIHSIGRSKGSWIESSLKCVLVEILWPPLQSYTGFPQGHCKADPASSFQRFIDYKRNSCLISRCWRLNPGTNGFFSKIGFQHKSVNARNGDIWATKWIRRPQIWDTVESLEVESMKLSRRLDKPFMVQGHQHEERGMYIKNIWFERKRACAHEYEVHHLGWLISLEIHLKPFAYTIARCFPHGFWSPTPLHLKQCRLASRYQILGLFTMFHPQGPKLIQISCAIQEVSKETNSNILSPNVKTQDFQESETPDIIEKSTCGIHGDDCFTGLWGLNKSVVGSKKCAVRWGVHSPNGVIGLTNIKHIQEGTYCSDV